MLHREIGLSQGVPVQRVFAIHARASTFMIVSHAVTALPRTELTGSSASAGEATRLIDMLSPDVVTLDARLPDGDGIELAEHLHAGYPGLGLVLFGPHRDRLLLRAVRAGVSAYVAAATADVAGVATAIGGCLAGHRSFSSRSLAGAVRNERPWALSRREREVTQLVRDGLGPADIARRLQVSESTVRTYLARAWAKAGVDPPTASYAHVNARMHA
jgi:DNA-binding NarL/FixJ family response regulator